jgi:hypothetical protein
MDFLKRYFGVEELLNQRQVQLQTEARQDDVLLRHLPCQAAVASYLLEKRHQNRKMTEAYQTTSFVNYRELAQQQLCLLQQQQQALDQSADPCRYLLEFKAPSDDPHPPGTGPFQP